jgi:hypothetical protein
MGHPPRLRLLEWSLLVNISAGKDTVDAVKHFRKMYPELPIIATGGPDEETIEATIEFFY